MTKLTILKRAPSPSMMETMMTNDELDSLEKRVDSTLRAIDAFLLRKAKPGNNNGDDDPDDLAAAGNNSNGNGDDDEEDDLVAKLGPSDLPPRYPGDPSHEGLYYPDDDLNDAMLHNDPRQSTWKPATI
jgi:hypothetical protein